MFTDVSEVLQYVSYFYQTTWRYNSEDSHLFKKKTVLKILSKLRFKEKPFSSNAPLKNPISNSLLPTRWAKIVGETL
jgi:hypothetical protein